MPSTGRQVVYGRNMVATNVPVAAQAGIQMMRDGGNAVDAAVATAACMSIVEPTTNGIGADMFAILNDGEKLVGEWVLVRMGKRRGEARNPWLLIKHRDETASKRDIADEAPRSVVSDRLLVEIARDEGGNMEKAADGDPPALLRKMLENPRLVKPPKKSGRKSVWHSNRGGSA